MTRQIDKPPGANGSAHITHDFPPKNSVPINISIASDSNLNLNFDPKKDILTDIDLLPVAEPAVAQPPGSGAGEYTDDAGSLIDGIGRLGSLGTNYWGRETEATTYFTSKALAAGTPGTPGIDTQSAFIPEISIRPLPPGEWHNIPIILGSSRGSGYSVSESGDAILFDEAHLNGGTVAGDVGTSLSAYLVYEIISNDGLTNVTIGDKTYAIANDGSVSGVVGYKFGADADGGCGGVSKAFAMAGSTPGTYYLAIEYTLDHAHGHTFSEGSSQPEQLGNLGVSAGSVNGAFSKAVRGIIDVQDDEPSLSMTSEVRHVDDHYFYLIAGKLTPRYGADGAYGGSDDCLAVSYEVSTDDNTSVTKTVTFDGRGMATVSTGLGEINFTKQKNGDISYAYIPNDGYALDHETITFTIMDGDTSIHDTSIKSLT